jgi:DNA-binding response OmpR family regulator
MRVLIAEDDKNFGFVLKGELEAAGHDVELANDGVDAVLRFIDGKHEFVLLDIKMPKLDGIHSLRIIKKLAPHVPAITYSGNAGSGEMAESVKAGAIRCLTKPFAIEQVQEEIRKYQARHGGAQHVRCPE